MQNRQAMTARFTAANRSELQATVDELTEFATLLKRFKPQKYGEIKQLQEHIRTQRKQEVQQQSTTKRKKSWGAE